MTLCGIEPVPNTPPSGEFISTSNGNAGDGPSPREILFFAIASDLANTRSTTLCLDGNLTMGQIRSHLTSLFPPLAPQLPICALAMDGVIAKDTDKLGSARAIAVLPPVSGG